MGDLVFLSRGGCGVITDNGPDYEISVFDGAPVKALADGSAVLLSGNDGAEIKLPLIAVTHLIDYGPELILYSTGTTQGVATYLGTITMNRDHLIEARVLCQVAQKSSPSGEVPLGSQ